MKQFPNDYLHTIGIIIAALAPAAIGAAVAQAWEHGLSWTQRLVQWAVGICVSYYVTGAIGAILHLDPFVAQAIGFVIAMVAFRATPAFIAASVAAVGAIPSGLLAKIGINKDPAS
ncbi:hypothetical protein [Sphingomonas oryzagri]|uniref:Uncharacterized protein n=1 Tax=Sphingomonas oryzagri TaxID=3042314 RepID=A0ABT6N7U7_9SPHN|nr:hypothetical protein [Sphingomonas oryzagri]MDH7641189.1 hypothetical protein [Sphingomonas oryzagri]